MKTIQATINRKTAGFCKNGDPHYVWVCSECGCCSRAGAEAIDHSSTYPKCSLSPAAEIPTTSATSARTATLTAAAARKAKNGPGLHSVYTDDEIFELHRSGAISMADAMNESY